MSKCSTLNPGKAKVFGTFGVCFLRNIPRTTMMETKTRGRRTWIDLVKVLDGKKA